MRCGVLLEERQLSDVFAGKSSSLMRKFKLLLKAAMPILALGVMSLPLAAATMQATFTGVAFGFSGEREQWGLGSDGSLDYTATYFYDTDFATTLDFNNTASVPVLSALLTINENTFELGSGQATYLPYPEPYSSFPTNIWAQYNATTDFVDQQSRFVQSMGQRAFFQLPDPTFDASAAINDPTNSELSPDFGYEFFTDEFRSRIYGAESTFDFAEYDLQTGVVTSRVFGFLSPVRPLTMQVSAVPLPASLPILLSAIGALVFLGRRRRALS